MQVLLTLLPFIAVLESERAIRTDQIGYPSTAPKIVSVVHETAATFSVHRRSDGKRVLDGELTPPLLDPDSGVRVRQADVSKIAEPGEYEIRIEGSAQPFLVATDPYRSLLRLTTRAFYGQRCGTAVDLGGGYAHAACHPAGAFHPSSGRTGAHPSVAGWHDAGDYGRYVVNSGISTGTLLWAWELFPQAFASMDLAIPESGNEVPDLLDEIRWNLRWMQSMQDEDGGAWQKQTSEEFPPFITPEEDGSVSYVIGTGRAPHKSSCATADLAAVMAIAARIYRPYDRDFAMQAEQSALRAWKWVSAHPDVVFRNPKGVSTGEYDDEDCSDERLWAAAEIWRSTGNEDAHAWFRAHARKAIRQVDATNPPNCKEVGALAAWSYALGGKGDAPLIDAIRKRTLSTARQIAERVSRHAWRIPLTTRDYVWGSNAVAANYGLHLLVANRMAGDRRLVDSALEVLHYLLGRNSFDLSWVTGAGQRSVQHPHHRPSGTDRNAAPWPGLLAGGPERHRRDPVLKALPPGLPPARVYVDDQESYASNEIAINWNAALVFLLAGCSER